MVSRCRFRPSYKDVSTTTKKKLTVSQLAIARRYSLGSQGLSSRHPLYILQLIFVCVCLWQCASSMTYQREREISNLDQSSQSSVIGHWSYHQSSQSSVLSPQSVVASSVELLTSMYRKPFTLRMTCFRRAW